MARDRVVMAEAAAGAASRVDMVKVDTAVDTARVPGTREEAAAGAAKEAAAAAGEDKVWDFLDKL